MTYRNPSNRCAPSEKGTESCWLDRTMRCVLRACVLPGLLLVAFSTSNADVISPRRLLEVVDLGNPVISPNGRYVAFRAEQVSVEQNAYDTSWYVQGLDGESPPRRVADGGIPLREYVTGLALPAPAVWSPDERYIYYRALIDGKVAVWRAAVNGSRAEPVSDDPADVRDFALSRDGRTLKYSVGPTREEVVDAEQAEYDRGIRIDESVFIGAGLFRSSQLEGRLATQRFSGDWFTTGPLMATTPDRWKAVDVTTPAKREVVRSDTPPSKLTIEDLPRGLPIPWKLAPHPQGDRIAILTRVGDDEGRLKTKPDVELAMLRNKRSGQPIKCQADLCVNKNITDIQWRPDSDEVLFTVVDRHKGRAWSMLLWNVSTGTVRPVVETNGMLAGGQRHWDIPCGMSSEVLVCTAAEADSPPRLESIDLLTGARQVLFDPNAALAQDIAATTPAELIRWTDVRGREFTGRLFAARRMADGPPPPLFVTFYTCDGFLRGGLGDEWPLASLAEQGISALCINGNPGYVDAVENYGQGRLAVESVVNLLSDRDEIDRSKVGMGGLSYGSEVTMWTAMRSDVLAAASVSGVSITPTLHLFNSLRENTLSVIEDNWQLRTPEETPERWLVLSPAFNLDKINAPILFQLPEQEYLMTLDYALPLVRRSQGDVYVFPNEAHIKFQPRHKLAVYERNVDWFRFWLQGHEDPDPSKNYQYSIWRAMRESLAEDAGRGDS